VPASPRTSRVQSPAPSSVGGRPASEADWGGSNKNGDGDVR